MPLPLVQDVLIEHLQSARNVRGGRTQMLPDGVLYASASSAGGCARAIALRVAKLEQTDPPTPDSLVNFYIGDAVHDVVQRAIVEKWPNATTEDGGVIGDFLVGHSDILYSAEDNERVVCEVKSTSDFGFKLATGVKLKSNGQWNKKDQQAEGPKREHKLQAGIYAVMHDAKYIAIVYVRKTAAKDEPILWEWRFTTESLKDATEAEIERLRGIVESVRGGLLPDREFNGEIIANPKSVRFPCGYCGYKKACISLGGGKVKIQ